MFIMEFVGIRWYHGTYSTRPVPGEYPGATLPTDPRFRSVYLNPAYQDAFAVLSPLEALEIARLRYKDPSALSASIEARAAAEKTLRDIEAALKEVTFVLAHVKEWESWDLDDD
jgi:hypothetical protein